MVRWDLKEGIMRGKLYLWWAAALALAITSPVVAGSMYMSTSIAPVSSLYTVAPSGSSALVGAVKTAGGGNLSLHDLGYDTTTNTMFATEENRLYTLDYANPVSGVVTATPVGDAGTGHRRGLTVSAGGTIYTGTYRTTTASGELYTLDATTGASTLVGSFGSPGGSYLGLYGDLAFSSGGILYGSMSWAGNSAINYLATINTATGAATLSANPLGTAIDGITFVGSTLYGVNRGGISSPGKLFTISTVTGQATLVGDTGVYTAYGLTLAPISPSILLVGSGLLGLGLWRRQRGNRTG